jgi:hypothetical protein
MKYSKIYDGFLNVFIPLLAGLLIYRMEQYFRIPALIRYYLPDGLWAYAFGSSMLIVWERKIHWGNGPFRGLRGLSVLSPYSWHRRNQGCVDLLAVLFDSPAI